MSISKRNAVKAEIDHLVSEFFGAVSFGAGATPSYGNIAPLFIDRGLLIKASTDVPEVSSVQEFVKPREALVASGDLTQFHESEESESTLIFGNVAHRFSVYAKSGITGGKAFEARGKITTQFVNTPSGWKMSAMAWDDERPGLSLADT